MNYTNPWLSGSKPFSIGTLVRFGQQSATNLFSISYRIFLKLNGAQSGEGQKVDNYFHRMGTAMGQIPRDLNHIAAGALPVRVEDSEGTKGERVGPDRPFQHVR